MNLICLILRDNSYGMIRWKQANLGFDDFGLEYGNPDFVKFAECHGAYGYRVEKTADFVHPHSCLCIYAHTGALLHSSVRCSEGFQCLNSTHRKAITPPQKNETETKLET